MTMCKLEIEVVKASLLEWFGVSGCLRSKQALHAAAQAIVLRLHDSFRASCHAINTAVLRQFVLI